MYGFAKNERDNITQDELAAFKKAAKEYLSLTEAQIATLLDNQAMTEVM
ncbi:type II toxin-antitoxin system RelE/ParE family toxin [Acaryochloris sp. CCMEE 5410]|nr:type II toxin-antitoxin system RelE/ParE family toxin [Acaryochloris sp. CCMEE 5410]